MKILLTGANGYIGTQLLSILLEAGHEVFVLLRRCKKFDVPKIYDPHLTYLSGDLLSPESLFCFPKDLEVAYYLVHSMRDNSENFLAQEKECAQNFLKALEKTKVRQIIYLSGLNNNQNLSLHLKSRLSVEKLFIESGIPYTIFKAGVIIGSGSASFEIIRDLVEKLPLMITPKWVNNKTQPIAISDVLFYLSHAAGYPPVFNKELEIGGPEKISYKEMLEKFAKVRGLKRYILDIPFLTPRLSSYWLYFITSTNFCIASSIVSNLKYETISKDNLIQELIPHKCISYEEAVIQALANIRQNSVVSSWKDAITLSSLKPNLQEYIQVPLEGCLIDKTIVESEHSMKELVAKLWKIGGNTGWYYANWAWNLRGFIDKLFGGTGLNRGRTHPTNIEIGNVIDFWRVLVADKQNGRLLLYAELKLPGEAWLEFKVKKIHGDNSELEQTATFRPKGLFGIFYWYALYPIHHFIFKRMAKAIAK